MLRHAVLPCRVSYSAYAGAASTNSVGVWGGCRAGVNWELGVQCACGVVSERLGAARQADSRACQRLASRRLKQRLGQQQLMLLVAAVCHTLA